MSVLAQNGLLVLFTVGSLGMIWTGAFQTPFRTIISALLSLQWLQVSMQLWLAELYRVDLTVPQKLLICSSCRPLQFLAVNDATVQTMVLAIFGLLSLFVGTRLFEPRMGSFEPAVSEWSSRRLFIGYLVFFAVDFVANYFIGGGLAGPLIALGSFKFAFVMLLTYVWIATKRGLLALFSVVTIEVIYGLTGFFSNFKGVFIVVGVASLTLARLHPNRVKKILLVTAPVLLLLISAWTVIKPSYRAVLNQGGRGQVVVIDMEQRLAALTDMIGSLDAGLIWDGVIGSASRLSYIEIPSYVVERVPQSLPYEYGGLLGETIYHMLTPRFLFPDKPVLPSDSVLTSHYTGRWYEATSSSISLGYLIESYIDFGIPGAVVIPFGLGAIYALIGRWLLMRRRGADLTLAVAILLVVLMPAQFFEMNHIKLLPTLLWGLMVGWTVLLVWPFVKIFFSLPLKTSRPIGVSTN